MSYVNKSLMIQQTLLKAREHAYIIVSKNQRNRMIKRHSFTYEMDGNEKGTGYYVFKIKKGYTLIEASMNGRSVLNGGPTYSSYKQTYSYEVGGGTFTMGLTITLSDSKEAKK